MLLPKDARCLSALSLLLLGMGCVPAERTMVPDLNNPAVSLAADPRVVAGLVSAPANAKAQSYSLPSLINIAQKNNPMTRAAWERAVEAAAAVDLVESTYLPRVSAEILAGQSYGTGAGLEDPLGLMPSGQFRTRSKGGVGLLSVQWLVFDFGVREASRAVATEVAFAANVGISGIHQTLIHDVTQSYYSLQAAHEREAVQRRRLVASEEIAAMFKARFDQDLTTVVELAQVNQLVAQAKFDLTAARTATAVASGKLVALTGLPVGTTITPAGAGSLRLPAQPPAQLNAFLETALQKRPDLQAAFARARASRAGVDAVEALFRPKIVASASVGRSFMNGRLTDDRFALLPGALSDQGSGNVGGVMVGMSIPLWDGNAREYRRQAAVAGAVASEAEARALRQLAEGEIIAAYQALKATLAANTAAGELVKTAKSTYGSAFAMGEQGLLTVAEIDAALKMVYDAELAQTDAVQAARSAAALLAFSTGRIGE